MTRSLSRRRFTSAVRRLVPQIQRADLAPAPAGVRAQAVRADGELVDDFAFRSVGRALHVLNAPSPAATASLEIGKAIATRLDLDDVLTLQIGSNSFAARERLRASAPMPRARCRSSAATAVRSDRRARGCTAGSRTCGRRSARIPGMRAPTS